MLGVPGRPQASPELILSSSVCECAYFGFDSDEDDVSVVSGLVVAS